MSWHFSNDSNDNDDTWNSDDGDEYDDGWSWLIKFSIPSGIYVHIAIRWF